MLTKNKAIEPIKMKDQLSTQSQSTQEGQEQYKFLNFCEDDIENKELSRISSMNHTGENESEMSIISNFSQDSQSNQKIANEASIQNIISELKNKIKSLESQNDSLIKRNKKLEIQYQQLWKQTDNLITEKNNSIKELLKKEKQLKEASEYHQKYIRLKFSLQKEEIENQPIQKILKVEDKSHKEKMVEKNQPKFNSNHFKIDNKGNVSTSFPDADNYYCMIFNPLPKNEVVSLKYTYSFCEGFDLFSGICSPKFAKKSYRSYEDFNQFMGLHHKGLTMQIDKKRKTTLIWKDKENKITTGTLLEIEVDTARWVFSAYKIKNQSKLLIRRQPVPESIQNLNLHFGIVMKKYAKFQLINQI